MNKANQSFVFTIAFSLLALAGCAHSTNRAVDSKLESETAVQSPSELRQELVQFIDGVEGLSPAQREKLLGVKLKLVDQLQALKSQALTIKSALLKETAQDRFSPEEERRLRDRLRKVESEKLDMFFKSLDEANTIMGKSAHRDQVYRRWWFSPGVIHF